MIDRKWREPAWRAAFCWPDLSALDSIDYIAWPGGDLLLQTVCIIPTCQRAKRGIYSGRRKTYFLSGFLVFNSQGNMSFLAAEGNSGENYKMPEIRTFLWNDLITQYLTEELLGKSTIQNQISFQLPISTTYLWFDSICTFSNLEIDFDKTVKAFHGIWPNIAYFWFLW